MHDIDRIRRIFESDIAVDVEYHLLLRGLADTVAGKRLHCSSRRVWIKEFPVQKQNDSIQSQNVREAVNDT